jgi:starvation-inducible outer membrane lipoprotein
MRLIVCLAFALSACSASPIRCDKHLQPINAPSAKASAATPAAAATAGKSP